MEKTDRELLELAARAAEIKIHEIVCTADGCYVWIITPSDMEKGQEQLLTWSPLYDDGDAFRLAARLGLGIIFGSWAPVEIYSITVSSVEGGDELAEEIIGNQEPYTATRRAIVRAAAAIGEAMQ